MPRNLYMVIAVVIAVVVLLDQITKILVRTLMTEGQSISIIDGFFSISYHNNPGVAFSFLSGQRFLVTLIQVVVVCLVAAILYFMKGKSILFDISLALVLGGGIGNLIDRIMYGKVTDMLSFSIFPPIFNVADIAVTVGCGLLLIDALMDMKK